MARIRVLAPLLLCSCMAMHGDDQVAVAEECVRGGRLLEALTVLDGVPPAQPRYAEARTLAQAVERRIRISQELLAKGLAMRSEWRDEEALQLFEQAARIWPRVAGAKELAAATNNRIAALERSAPAQGLPEAHTTIASPTTEPQVPPQAAAPAVETAKQPDMLSNMAAMVDPQRHAHHLSEAQELLERGEMGKAMDLLESLYQSNRTDAAVVLMLVRVLNQRALLRYGQGWLELAIADWSRILELRPQSRQAAEFIAAARAELEERKRH